MAEASDASRYEAHAPQTGVSGAQAAERMQRNDLREGRRTRRVSVLIPALPASMTKTEED